MILVLLSVMFLSISSVPLPEFQIQREIPVFGGVDWHRSRRGVCYDKDSVGSVSMGHQFYLDCGRCTCDRYGFWCVPKCALFIQPDLDNCVEIVLIADTCCPRKECVKYKDPTQEPSTNPWATVSYFNRIETDKRSDNPAMTMPMTEQQMDHTTEPTASFESTTKEFGGAFTTKTQQMESGATQSTDELVTGPEATETTRRDSSTYHSFTTPNAESSESTLPNTENSSTESVRSEEPRFASTDSELTTTSNTDQPPPSSAPNSIYTVASATPAPATGKPFPAAGPLTTGPLATVSSKPVSRETQEWTTETTDSSSVSSEDAPTDGSSGASRSVDLATTRNWDA